MYINRYLEETILAAHKTFKVLYLGGPRQVGKTTILLHLAKKFKLGYVSLDDLSARRLADEDPELFLQKYPAPLLIDEVQYAPALFPYIKLYVDRSKRNGQYWLTGSQQFSVMKNVKESLAGRVAILTLLGFSLAEILKYPPCKTPFSPDRQKQKLQSHARRLTIRQIFEKIFRGSFPALTLRNAPRIETFYNSYLQTYLDRDLKELFHITKISTFHTFLQLCAARTGQLLNYSDLARDAGISVHAAREWISILETSFQIYLLRPYFKNISKRLIKAPKLYFLDTGLAAFLAQWKTPATLMNGAAGGAFFETFIVSEIIKSYLFRGQQPPLYYFRDKERHEVDLIIERENVLYPIEIKMASAIKISDAKNLKYFQNKIKHAGNSTVISLSADALPLNRTVEIVPAWMIA